MTATRSPFDVLGVPHDATAAEVRRAYRRLALRYHPDRNAGDPVAQNAFLDVQQAYEALGRTDADAGFDAERVAAQMQRAAEEAERRRSRAGEGGPAWQQVRVALDRPRHRRVTAALGTPRTVAGLGLAVALGAAVAAGLAPLWALAGAEVALPAWAPLAAGAALAVGAASGAVLTAEPPPWAVETHWQGLRDLRWDVLVGWAEIRGVRQAEGALELALTAGAVRRLAPLVPPEAFGATAVYRLPLRDGARLLAVLDAHRAG